MDLLEAVLNGFFAFFHTFQKSFKNKCRFISLQQEGGKRNVFVWFKMAFVCDTAAFTSQWLNDDINNLQSSSWDTDTEKGD